MAADLPAYADTAVTMCMFKEVSSTTHKLEPSVQYFVKIRICDSCNNYLCL